MKTARPSLSKYIVVDDSRARADRVWFRVSARLERGRRGSMRRTLQLLAMCAAVVVAFCAGWIVTQGRTPTGWAHLETSGDAVSFELRDGSRLTLQKQTRVELRESSDSRVALELERGHLDCSVTPNPRRAFAVAAAGFEFLVLGTQFGVDLSLERRRLEVDVQVGSVAVYRRGKSEPELALHAGQRWAVDLLETLAPAAALAASSPASDTALPSALASTSAAGDAGADASPAAPAADSRDAVTRPSNSRSRARLGARQLLDRANAARRAGDLMGALRAYEQLLATYPNDSRAGLAAFEVGRLRMDRLGDVRGALAPLERAANLVFDPGLREDAMARLVRAFDVLGQNEQCLEARGRYLESHPTGVYVGSVAEACELTPRWEAGK
jgi:hypothetical protein